MKRTDTKQEILRQAVKLFAKEGCEAVTVEMIASAVGIKAPSLYKHYKSKEDIFLSVLKEMERRDAENADDFALPQETKEVSPQEYDNIQISAFAGFCKQMFRYWTEDEFASAFRRMLTVEQYRSEKMNAIYHQYLGDGPLNYTADVLGSMQAALALYGPMYLLYSVYDMADDKEKVYKMFDEHIERWLKNEISIK